MNEKKTELEKYCQRMFHFIFLHIKRNENYYVIYKRVKFFVKCIFCILTNPIVYITEM